MTKSEAHRLDLGMWLKLGWRGFLRNPTRVDQSVVKQDVPLTLRGQRVRCRNIKGDLEIFGSFPKPRLRPLFPLGVLLWWALANTSCVPNLKLPASAVAQILKGNPQILRRPSSPGPHHFFFGVYFIERPLQQFCTIVQTVITSVILTKPMT